MRHQINIGTIEFGQCKRCGLGGDLRKTECKPELSDRLKELIREQLEDAKRIV